MKPPINAIEKIQEILEIYGGETSKKAIKSLLEDPDLIKLKPFTEYIAKTWRDPFVPALMNLSCKAVNGEPKETEEAAIALSLMNLSFRIWDDIIDKTYNTNFKATFVGKFGEANALIVGGIISAKAFTILNGINLEPEKKKQINELMWTYWTKMAYSETIDLEKSTEKYSSEDKLRKIKDETVNIKTCLEVGAIIGNASIEEIESLIEFGECLGILMELVNDAKKSMNLTLELGGKISHGRLPYFILEAKEISGLMEEELDRLNKKQIIEPKEIGFVVNLLVKSAVLDKAENYIRGLIKKGKVALRCLKQTDSREKLFALIEHQQTIFNDFL